MARLEATTGRYVYLDVQGTEYRVYFEEAGSGIPLVCQHTAGSDGKQWRHFLTDADITGTFRVIVPICRITENPCRRNPWNGGPANIA